MRVMEGRTRARKGKGKKGKRKVRQGRIKGEEENGRSRRECEGKEKRNVEKEEKGRKGAQKRLENLSFISKRSINLFHHTV